MLNETVTVVLAGGTGTRLAPLTLDRAKPAVPFGGKYRIIDFALSNCLHSGLRRILVLTQYKSHSLQKHLRNGWSIFNPELGEYITTVPPQMRTGENWYEGTADAIYQNLYLIERSGAQWVLILAGDHIYRMDYEPMLKFHRDSGAGLTVACMTVPIDEAGAFGVLSLDEQKRINHFAEKPEQPQAHPTEPGMASVSMGIYVFSTSLLLDVLRRDHGLDDSSHDFGSDIIPHLLEGGQVYGYEFGGSDGRVSQDRYWRDVGTIDSYYAANMDLLKPLPPVDLYQSDWHVRTYAGQYPPARTAPGSFGTEGICINSISSSGTVITGGSVQNSILFNNVFVDEDSFIENSLLFDGVKVGKGCRIKNCIVDKYVNIPDGTVVGYDLEADRKCYIQSPQGINVIAKNHKFINEITIP
ncbi:MAG: glucose-1-phosphate adenylyltransferase [Gammaproteobacteria bacterium]|nr:glucose-1-phosphate adenylyltransferase [Gammaproteobacteria bacterium]MDH5800995.1 glucose-1-phosphate adenylyltransferase [Gammaproteobacteria bacterium]